METAKRLKGLRHILRLNHRISVRALSVIHQKTAQSGGKATHVTLAVARSSLKLVPPSVTLACKSNPALGGPQTSPLINRGYLPHHSIPPYPLLLILLSSRLPSLLFSVLSDPPPPAWRPVFIIAR